MSSATPRAATEVLGDPAEQHGLSAEFESNFISHGQQRSLLEEAGTTPSSRLVASHGQRKAFPEEEDSNNFVDESIMRKYLHKGKP